MSARKDPTRREDLLFMLLHGGAASESIACHVVDNAIAEAVSPLAAEVQRLREERHSTNEALSEAAEALRVQRDRIAELETLLSDRSEPDVDGAGRTYTEYHPPAEGSEDVSPQVDGMRPGERRLAERAFADLEATHWKRLDSDPPSRQSEEDPRG